MEISNYRIKRRKVQKLIRSMNLPLDYPRNVNKIMPFVRGVSADRRMTGQSPMTDNEIRHVALVALNNVLSHGVNKT
jgi:hypothetical protein